MLQRLLQRLFQLPLQLQNRQQRPSRRLHLLLHLHPQLQEGVRLPRRPIRPKLPRWLLCWKRYPLIRTAACTALSPICCRPLLRQHYDGSSCCILRLGTAITRGRNRMLTTPMRLLRS